MVYSLDNFTEKDDIYLVNFYGGFLLKEEQLKDIMTSIIEISKNYYDIDILHLKKLKEI